MNDQEKQLYEKVNLDKLKTEIEVLTTSKEHFNIVKPDSIDNDFDKWHEDK